MEHRWKAHTDCINWVTYAKEIDTIASCSFDCNVFMWDIKANKIGSLVLGNEGKNWQITIDKSGKNKDEVYEATSMLDEVARINYENMFSKLKKDKGENMAKVIEKD